MASITTLHKRPGLRVALVSQLNRGVLVLGYLVLLGVIAGILRLGAGLGLGTGLNDGYPWGIWIGFDFTLIAFSGAGFTMAGLVYVLRQGQFRPALRPAVLAALLGYVGVLALLVLDLGRPDRFYHFLLFWNVHSPLFEISWCVLLYTTVLIIEVLPLILERLQKHRLAHLVHRAIIPVAIAALTLSTLHQSTLGTLYLNMPYRLHPLWFSPMLPVLFFVSSVAAGLSMAIITYRVAARAAGVPVENAVSSGLAKIVGWVGALYLVLKLAEMGVAGELPLLFAFDRYSILMWCELALVAVGVVVFFTPADRSSVRGQWAGAGLFLAGTLLSRFNATLFAQIGSPSAAYAPHLIEWLTTAGVLAAVALAWYLGARLLAVFERTNPLRS